jgi:hypothetical protein
MPHLRRNVDANPRVREIQSLFVNIWEVTGENRTDQCKTAKRTKNHRHLDLVCRAHDSAGLPKRIKPIEDFRLFDQQPATHREVVSFHPINKPSEVQTLLLHATPDCAVLVSGHVEGVHVGRLAAGALAHRQGNDGTSVAEEKGKTGAKLLGLRFPIRLVVG